MLMIMIFAIIVLLLLFLIDKTVGIITVVGIVVVAPIVIIWENEQKKEKRAEHLRLMRETDEILAKVRDDAEEAFLNVKGGLVKEYGEPNQIIDLNEQGEYWLDRYIMVFADAEVVYLDGEEYAFDDILMYRWIDNCKIQHGDIYGETDSAADLVDVVGRGATGAMIGDEVGAVIGVSSAPRTAHFELSQDNDTVIHDYTLVVTTKNFDAPTIKIHIGDDWESAVEVDALFARIMDRKMAIADK